MEKGSTHDMLALVVVVVVIITTPLCPCAWVPERQVHQGQEILTFLLVII